MKTIKRMLTNKRYLLCYVPLLLLSVPMILVYLLGLTGDLLKTLGDMLENMWDAVLKAIKVDKIINWVGEGDR